MEPRAPIDPFEGAGQVVLRRELDRACGSARCLADFAQAACTAVHERAGGQVGLLRCFVVSRLSEQPAGNQAFAREWMRRQDQPTTLLPTTPTLALIGTAGTDPGWNDRKRSVGHLAIPMVSSRLIARVPLVASLFEQLGVGLDWLHDAGPGKIREVGQRAERQFFAPDVARLLSGRRDAKAVGGKRVLHSQLRCGFGAASPYMTQDAFLIVVGFAERALDPRSATLATMLARYVRAGTYRMVDAGRWFG
ncbi:hypothetical protein ACNOYE_22745 [Nannocystaceae bacterium ST9]